MALRKDMASAADRIRDAALHGLLDAIATPVWVSGEDGACRHVNHAWQALTGMPASDALGSGWEACVHPDDVPALRDVVTRPAEAQAGIEPIYRLRARHGEWRTVHERRAPFRDGGRLAGVVGSACDRTELAQCRAELQRTKDDHERLVIELQHRLRNSTQVATSLLSLQSGRASHPKVGRALRAAAVRIGLTSLVQEHMLLAGPEVEFGETLTATAQAAVAATQPRLRLSVRPSRLRLPVSRAQPLALAICELITNAAMHAYPEAGEGPLEVTLEVMEDRSATLAVADNGVGMPQRRRQRPGAGRLGLHLADRLARQAGGRLAFENAAGTRALVHFQA